MAANIHNTNRMILMAILIFGVTACTSTPATQTSNPLDIPPSLPNLEATPLPSSTLAGGVCQYENPVYGFSFNYRCEWMYHEETNRILLSHGSFTLGIGFRFATEDIQIQRTGVGAGDIVTIGSVDFLEKELSRDVLIYQGKEKSVLYHYGMEFEINGVVFTLSPDDFGTDSDGAGIPEEIQNEADQIIESFDFDQ